ncbi:hypothetical protein FA95DRAFT_1583933 [Auriscalpium vulgare]|uniref:Uncharacterized protein n=1 Tax=Auriscalpium vulgare TaxID=40419 RepID=A0ACB8RJU5_9AGAM|nr:hypothetical protein FA95DRAFT_1583933 [Auriscalpium vulgare]
MHHVLDALAPTPLQSFLGGVGLALPVHAFLVLNGGVFGISGFLHRAARGAPAPAAAVAGLVLGGVVVGAIEHDGPRIVDAALAPILASGLLVGLGTKVRVPHAHMLAGVARLSPRSIAATAVFCTTGVYTTRVLHAGALPPVAPPDATLGAHGPVFFAGSLLAVLAAAALPRLAPLTALLTALAFALALRLSNLVDPHRVLAFLALPAHPAFDPSLAFLAAGAIPLAAALYRAGAARIAPVGKVDARLLAGAALFGVGWGVEGICPGPALVNFGQALAAGQGAAPLAAWLAAFVVGGRLAGS